ncbi:MAG: branched-chain amino acid aminotransferase, partial [Marmoricola sp.]|nr:branched-chain amino acid aminotransferase [Marmoricola sp.]
MTLDITTSASESPRSEAEVSEILVNPGFGTHFTDHMFAVEWTPEKGWHDARITAYGPLSMDPASAVLHYAQETFEGMKAYRHEDGSIWSFRPYENAKRMARSSHRLAFPVLDPEDFVQAVDALVAVDQRWVPEGTGEKSLYIRPFMIASEVFLG